MGGKGDTLSTGDGLNGQAAAHADRPFKVFLNYRREDGNHAAARLYDALAPEFGGHNIFFDANEPAGIDWLHEIKSHGLQASVFLALVGPNWATTLTARSELPTKDYVRREIEWALRDWPGVVIPVLLDAPIPEEDRLPRSVRGLWRKQAAPLRHTSFDGDVGALIARLKTIESDGSDPAVPETTLFERDRRQLPVTLRSRKSRERAPGVSSPGREHYAEVADAMCDGTVVPVLGSNVRGTLPETEEIASHLAIEFGVETDSDDLAEIAQYIAITKGERRLHAAIREIIARASQPTDLHLFLAEFPRLLRGMELTPSYQMIVSTSHDRALEQAFEDVNEPFDYAVFVASKGRFAHLPWGEDDGEALAQVIDEPGRYSKFPIDDAGELQRTIIVKIHGTADGTERSLRWVDDCVITEDQYIDYLPTENIQECVPVQIIDKLKASSCLFLGYMMRDWNARVFLRRLWQRERITENSWAIEQDPDVLEKDSWRRVVGAELLAAALPDYVGRLRASLLDEG